MSATALYSTAEVQAFLRAHARVHVRGRGSKSALHEPAVPAAHMQLAALSGIVDYQPSEYTITARAGTSIAELAAVLAQQGQYLPFDPLLPGSASLGGTVAGNLSGPRSYRYGRLRDFILGAQLVDGLGRAFRVGGKVVKNAAGFDLSKFLVGSLGAYGVMTELTFKVFPDLPLFRTLRLDYARLDGALAAMLRSQALMDLDALDLLPQAQGWALLVRIGGYRQTLSRRVERFLQALARDNPPDSAGILEDEGDMWCPLVGLGGRWLTKVVLSPRQIRDFDAPLQGQPRRYSVAGNVAYVACEGYARMDAHLQAMRLRGLCLIGKTGAPVMGIALENVLLARVKQVLDPQQKLV